MMARFSFMWAKMPRQGYCPAPSSSTSLHQFYLGRSASTASNQVGVVRAISPLARTNDRCSGILGPGHIWGHQWRREKGHSKWQNIMHTKKANDVKMSKITGRYVNLVVRAVRENGGETNLKYNSALTRVWEDALAENVTKATLEGALKRAKSGEAEGVNCLLEVRGPGNSFLLVDAIGKSRAHATDQIRGILKRKGGVLDKGMASMFDHRGVVIAQIASSKTFEAAEEDAIECGAEEVEGPEGIEEGSGEVLFRFLCSPVEFSAVRKRLQGSGYSIVSAAAEYLPKHTIDISTQKEIEALKGLVEAMEGSDYVTAVYHNCSI